MIRVLKALAICLCLTGAHALVEANLFAGRAIAQTAETAPNYAEWEAAAKRAELAIQDGQASTDALDTLRAEIAAWREKFLAAQGTNDTRIKTLRDQITALGEVPTDGTAELPEIATRRTELNDQLARLQVPVRTAEEAFSRADGLISEIDTLVRERQTADLLQLGPSPLNPVYWPAAIESLAATIGGMAGELKTGWASPAQQANLRNDLPLTLFYLVLGIVLVVRGRSWMESLTLRTLRRFHGRGAGVRNLLVSLGQIILPVGGLVALTSAILTTNLLGARGEIVVGLLPWVGLIFFVARWLSQRLFPKADVRSGLFVTDLETNKRMRLYFATIGAMIGLRTVLDALAQYDAYDAASRAVLLFVPLVISGLLIAQIGRVLLRLTLASEDAARGDGPAAFRGQIVNLIARVLFVFGLFGPAMAAVGYLAAGSYLVYPTAVSLALIGGLLVLQSLFRDIYRMITDVDDAAAREALVPILFGFAAVVLALPVFALIWGARLSDLSEIWARAAAGFSIGDTRISPSNFLTFVLVFTIGYGLTRLVQSALRTTVLPKTKMDPGGRTAVVSGLGYVGIFTAALVAITTAGIDLSSLAIVAGALSVGIGFGLQNIVSNFVAGIILLIERPISEGDWIDVGGHTGIVRGISVRSTRIETFDRTDVIIPNADLVSGAVTNWTRGNLLGRLIVPVGVAYGTDTRKVEKILLAIANDHPIVSIDPGPTIIFSGFGADSLDFEIRAILSDVNFTMAVKNDLNHEIAKRFAEEGIEIPFAQRDVWLRNPEALRAAPERAPNTKAEKGKTDTA